MIAGTKLQLRATSPPARRRTAMMFRSYALFPHLDCVDNVSFGPRMSRSAPIECT
jgi:putative spermidine/putrescine transport system ATP-binding protein